MRSRTPGTCEKARDRVSRLHVSGDDLAVGLRSGSFIGRFSGETAVIPAIGVEEVAGLRLGGRTRVTAAIAGVVEAALGVGGIVGVGLGANAQLQIPGFPCRCVFASARVPIERLVGIAEDVAVERSFFERVAFGFMPADQKLGSNTAQRDDYLDSEVVHASQQACCYPTLAFDVEAMADPVFGESEGAGETATLIGASVESLWRSTVGSAGDGCVDLFPLRKRAADDVAVHLASVGGAQHRGRDRVGFQAVFGEFSCCELVCRKPVC